MANERLQRRGQRGSFVVMFAMLLFFLVACLGLAIDVGQVYSRQSELQAIADSAALAAAAPLDGTAAGVNTALQRASAITAANYYAYGKLAPRWADAALQFGATADGAWLDASAAAQAPQALRFARVDSAGFGPAPGQVDTIVLALLAGGEHGLFTAARAVAGRRAIHSAALAICAMQQTPAADVKRADDVHELVEFGFRRGVGYNLLALNPNGSAPVSYLLDALAGTTLAAPARLRGFMCNGSLALPRLPLLPELLPDTLHLLPVTPGLFDYAGQLNSRFDLYPGVQPCHPVSAPPDTNVQQFTPTWHSWMAVAPAGQSAASAIERPPLQTVADLPAISAQTTAASYGPLWAYGPAAKYGGGVFGLDAWSKLYPVSGSKLATSKVYPYPNGGTPYNRGAGPFLTVPSSSHTGQAQRRVLLVPLLQCVAGQAPRGVLAVGRFFMTAQADASQVSGEFAGLASAAELAGPVGLYQ